MKKIFGNGFNGKRFYCFFPTFLRRAKGLLFEIAFDLAILGILGLTWRSWVQGVLGVGF